MEEALKHIEKNVVDRRKYRKSIRKQFARYEKLLRFHKNAEYRTIYKQGSKDIMDVLFRTLDSDKTYETRNLYFLFSIMEVHFTFYSDMVKRLITISDNDTLQLAHDAVFQKNTELLELLINNEKDPVTAEQLEKAMENRQDD
jgi:hypothetical protein